MIEELPSRRAGLPLHPRARAAGAVRPAVAACAGRSCTCASARRSRRAGRALGPRARRPRAPLRRRGAARRQPSAAIDYNVLRRRGRPPPRSPSTRRRRACAPRSSWGSRTRAERAEMLLELGTASHRAGKALDALDAFAAAAEIARELGDAELLARAAIGYEDACWRPGIADQGAVELLEEAAAALGDESSRAARRAARRARARARLPGRSRARARSSATSAIAHGAAARTTAPGSPRCWCAPTGRAARRSLEEILDDAHRGARPRRGARRHRDPRRGDGLARADVRRARAISTSARREVAALRADRRADRAAVHAPRRRALRLGDRAVRRAPRRGRGAARALARVEPAADRARRRRASTGSRCSASAASRGAWPSSRRWSGSSPARPSASGPWRPGLAALLVELGMEARRGASWRGSPPTGSTSSASRCGWPRSTYLTDACAALGDEAIAALVYPELEPLAGTNVMIGHLVACYGAADRYLGMLAATLGEWERAEAHFERAHGAQPAHGDADVARPHRLRVRARCCWRAAAATASGAAALLGEAGGARRADRHAGAARAGSARSAPPRRRAGAARRALRRARSQILAPRRPRAQQPRDRRARCSISEHTAANHIRSILRKTGCANRTEAASYAHRHGLVEPERARDTIGRRCRST